jgi:predicted ATP-dependent endonuclease of OLD family
VKIDHVVIRNYRVLRDTVVSLNPGMNLLVGDNEAGKSTFLEAVHLALTCQLNGRSLRYQLHPHIFNAETSTDYCRRLSARELVPPPEIIIELYFTEHDDLVRLKGTNNSERVDAPGIRLAVRLDDAFADDYTEYLGQGTVTSVPVEFYTVDWLTFANEPVHPRRLPFKSRLIDASTIMSDRGPSRYVLDVVEDCIGGGDKAAVALAYRLLKEGFIQNSHVSALNTGLADRRGEVSEKQLSISLDTTSSGSWENAVVPLLNEIPYSMVGKGEQASLKIRLAMEASSEAAFVLIEEPENHQSHTRLNALISRLQERGPDKQFIISTHSSFVVNKLGIADVLLFKRDSNVRLTDLDPDTQSYFRKLPGHDTLRLILTEKAILVEGPSDELVVQRAYRQKHGRLPLADGMEVISVRSLSFRRFIEIATLLGVRIAVVTDNDTDSAAAEQRWATDDDNVLICIGQNNDLLTLEDQLVAVNELELLNEVLNRNAGTKEELVRWMKNNKTEAALRIFDSTTDLSMPRYIDDATNI